jgi:hypothetical protein
MEWLLSRSQTRTVASSEPETRLRPLLENAIELIISRWPVKTGDSVAPVFASQSLIEQSVSEADAINPRGEKATAVTFPMCSPERGALSGPQLTDMVFGKRFLNVL